MLRGLPASKQLLLVEVACGESEGGRVVAGATRTRQENVGEEELVPVCYIWKYCGFAKRSNHRSHQGKPPTHSNVESQRPKMGLRLKDGTDHGTSPPASKWVFAN